MRKDGQITVFLAVVVICISALMAGLLESARTAGARWYLKTAANSALDSVMSQYHKELWENYHILMRQFDDEKTLSRNFEDYINKYMEAENFYPMGVESCELTSKLTAVDEDGALLEQEILDYMKYGAWNLEKDPANIESNLKNLMEAGNIKDITSAYNTHAGEAFQLEQALDKIGDSQKKQQEYHEEGILALRRRSGYGFRRAAEKLTKELEKIPRLKSDYEKKAEKLKDNLSKTEEDSKNKEVFLQADTAEALKQELSCYRDYIDEDGKRRREVERLEDEASRNQEMVEDALDRLEEVEDIIDMWDEDEDGYLDEGELWNSVIRSFDRCRISQMESSHGIKDQGKKKALESIEKMLKFDLLKLVLPPDRQISKGVVAKTEFPSSYMDEREWDMEPAWKNHNLPSKLEAEGLVKNVAMNEYGAWHFSDYMWDQVRPQEKKEVQYELEYILCGKDTDEENLKTTALKLLYVREGLNLLHIITDEQKRGTANQAAAAIVGYTGMAPLVAVTAFFVMASWALAEAVLDLKILFAGKKVPFFKDRESWKLELDQIFSAGGFPDVAIEEDQDGMNYEGYLKCFLLLQDRKVKCFRYMDVMQMNIRRAQKDFLMKNCAYKMEIICRTSGRIRLNTKVQKTY